MAYFIDFLPGDVLEVYEGYKTYKPKRADLEPNRNVFVAIIEEMSRYCKGDKDCIGQLQAAMGIDYLGLYTNEGGPSEEKLRAFTKAIHSLLAAKTPPSFVQEDEVESYFSELQDIAEYLINHR